MTIEICGCCSRPIEKFISKEFNLSQNPLLIDGVFYSVKFYSNGNIKLEVID